MNKQLIKDLAKKRREYLQTKVRAKTLVFTGPLLVCGGMFIGLMTGNTLIHLIVTGFVMLTGWLIYRANIQTVRSLAYVPPVAEQIGALPSEQILVRGSDQPTATPEELLRAANVSSETASDELLRPNTSVIP